MLRNVRLFVFVLAMVVLVSGAVAQEDGTFTLQILHSSDNESSFQDPNTLEPKLLNYATIVEGLRQLSPEGNTLHLTAGDHVIPGPFYQAAAEVDSVGVMPKTTSRWSAPLASCWSRSNCWKPRASTRSSCWITRRTSPATR